jgi:hypothetical protein
MGGSMSIQNATNVPLDISIDQLGPLYYQSTLAPFFTSSELSLHHWVLTEAPVVPRRRRKGIQLSKVELTVQTRSCPARPSIATPVRLLSHQTLGLRVLRSQLDRYPVDCEPSRPLCVKC